MDPEQLRSLCLSFGGSQETFPFGPETSVFKVAEKIFALSALHAEQMIAEMIEDSYDLIVSKLSSGRRRELGWRGDQHG